MENIKKNFDSRELIDCPWCSKYAIAPPSRKNMVIVYSCTRCHKPIIFFNKRLYKMDEELLTCNDPHLIEEYILEFLESEGFNLLAKKLEEFFEEAGMDDDEITVDEIDDMKIFLTDFKIPIEGDFL